MEADRGERLFESLGSPILAEAASVEAGKRAPADAVRIYDAALRASGAADLALDMGRRALARATAQKAGSAGFAAELFAEAAAYYVSRDLPSVIGKELRVTTPAETIRLKDAIRSVARNAAESTAREVGSPTGQAPVDAAQWRVYVGGVVRALQGGTEPTPPLTRPRAPRRPKRGDRG